MTLCVAWNSPQNIYLASDSRTSNCGLHSDFAIKVFSVPVRVFSPSNRDSGTKEIVFDRSYGMCFAGSLPGAFVVREFLMNVLQRLQCVPGHVEGSFQDICLVIHKFYKHIVSKLSEGLKYNHSIDFFISGYCRVEKRIMIAKFRTEKEDSSETLRPMWEILDSTKLFVEAIGSGQEEFRQNLDRLGINENQKFRVLHAIKATIDGRREDSVGGNIQYGKFDKFNNFSTFGVTYHDYDAGGLLALTRYCIAGIDMIGTEFDPKDDELFITGAYIDPFLK